MTNIKNLKAYLKTAFQAVPCSVKGYVNTSELTRVLFFAIAAGGSSSLILAALNESLQTILVQPADFAVVSAILVAIIEIQRRLQHGCELPPTVSSQIVDAKPVDQVNKTNWFFRFKLS